MSDKFKGKYSRASLRADWIDYSNTALFHITICTQNREHYFGAIKDGKMIHSIAGEMAIGM